MPYYTNDAMELLAKLADYGDRNAQKMLGWHYLNGILVKKDAQKAYHYHCKAANQNDVEANLILGGIMNMVSVRKCVTTKLLNNMRKQLVRVMKKPLFV